MTMFKVAKPGFKWTYFKTLAEARAHANKIFVTTGAVVAIEAFDVPLPTVRVVCANGITEGM